MTAETKQMQASRLRCEHFTNPLGIDYSRPRLSWECVDGRRGARQSAYQIRVASGEDALAQGSADLWDSGKVDSDDSVLVPYEGRALASRERAWWRVRLWDAEGAPGPWSEPAWWEMGLLDAADWQGEWVGGMLAGGRYTSNPAPFVRAAFTLDRPVKRARLYSTALGLYEAHLNGQVVSSDVFTPGWTDYKKRVQYQVYDVTGLVRTGENALGAVLGDGWYCGYVGWDLRQQYGDRPRFLAQLELTFEDGSTQVIATGPDWKTIYGPILESDFQMGESYDARLELDGWDAPGYDDTRWLTVERFADPGIERNAMRGPSVQRIEEIRPAGEPVKIDDGARALWIFDLGQNMVGRVRVRVSGPAGTTITLRHAEVLNPDGTLYTTNLRRARATDHYTLRGEGALHSQGEEVYEPRFTFHGFRYVELSGFPGTPGPETITGVVLHSAMEQTGRFECSDPLLNQLQHNIEWGQRGNFVDVPTDCPQRDERLGWTGDAQVFMQTAAFNRDVAGLITRWARDMEDSQTPEGAYPCVVPNPGLAGADGGPAWADAGLIVPWTIYQSYGDAQILAERYDSMCRYVEFLKNTSRDGQRNYAGYTGFKGHGDWLALDGGKDAFGATPFDLVGTAFYAYSAHMLAQIAARLGKTEDAARYEGLFKEARQAFQERFVTPAGLVASGTQTSYVLALYFDLLPENLREAALDELVADIQRRGNHLSTGFVGTPYLNRVLSDNGRTDTAYALLKQTSWPSWLYSVTQGATTIWERWDGWTAEKGFQDAGMNSFNHYAYGAIGAWLYAVVAGIDLDPECPGYKRILMRPQPGGGLTRAQAELRSPYGKIRSEWKIEDGKINWQITIPANTTARVYVPVKEGQQVTAEEGAQFVGKEKDAAVYEVTAGEWKFGVR